MIQNLNNFSIVPCIILSVILHGAVFFVIYEKNKQETFIQVPLEVSFYAPNVPVVPVEKVQPADIVKENTEPLKKKDVEKIEKNQPRPETSSEIVVAKKDEDKKKKIVEEKTEKISEAPVPEKEKEPVKEEKSEAATAEEQKENTDSSSTIESSQYSKGIMLENKNFKYSYYTGAILKKIRRYWQDSNINILRTVVYFKIERDGTVSRLKIHKSSKNSTFDKNALRAVELASPFPPLPDGYTEDNLGVYFEFKTT